MTICRQWAWKPDDELKSLPECLHTLIRTVGGDGNLLLNVGPMPDGRIRAAAGGATAGNRPVARPLRRRRLWHARRPLPTGAVGPATCKANQINLFVTEWPASGPLVLPHWVCRLSVVRICAAVLSRWMKILPLHRSESTCQILHATRPSP